MRRYRKLGTLETLWLLLAFSWIPRGPACTKSFAWLRESLASTGLFLWPRFAGLVRVFPPEALSWLHGELVSWLQKASRREHSRWHGLRLLAADKTTLALHEFGSLWECFGAHKGSRGLGPITVELCCLFDLMFPASELARLDHMRWDIETFYRDFKCTLSGSSWHCQSPRSFHQELLVHMIALCLIRIAMLEAGRHKNLSVAQISFARWLMSCFPAEAGIGIERIVSASLR